MMKSPAKIRRAFAERRKNEQKKNDDRRKSFAAFGF